ncbi:hypothetical protein D9601_02600 [Sphingomonas sp. MA1305]|uniref:hypothetical protein n=1 Tax=Sphingomonas sp. MA1305 TaxID=2479204 RepID=UPI0018DF8160|nr:hypothetical protein [Sphingomonas sp. MA1305]MBI0474255.1 hypothetical protein [Sphingomonas sp. MA1305]
MTLNHDVAAVAREEVLALANRVEAGWGISNSLDAEIEIALFNPPEDGFRSVRRNAAGTKLIYTRQDGKELTCWARDWTLDRPRAVALLRARAHLKEQER